MALFRGTGGSGDASTDTYASEVALEATRASTKANEAAASATSAANAQAAAETAQAAAETAKTNAETAETNAETAETNAETAENAAVAAKVSAETAKTAADTAQSAAEVAKTAAETAETNAETAETNAAASATTATTKAGEAATSATNAASSASSASTSATNAATSATAAQTAQTAAEAAKTAAEAAQDAIDGLYLGAQSSNPTVDLNGNAVTTGDWYFNTGDNSTRIYTGSAWDSINPNLVGDTSPQLGGNLDLNSRNITGTGNVNITGNVVLSGTVDGRDVAADGTKLDGVEASATADQTAAEIRTLVESASDSNVFTDADHSKLNAIEAGATADQTATEIKTLVGSASDSNVFTDADHSKLDGIEASATADQTAAEIRTLVESASDSNVFTDADHTKLNAIEASATADQTDAEIRAAVEAATDSNVFTDADHSKLNAIEASADVTDTANVTAAGALMDSEVTNLSQVKAFDTSDYATAAQGAKADTAHGWGNHASAGYLTGNQTITLSGAVTGSGTTSITTTLSTIDGGNLLMTTIKLKNGSGAPAGGDLVQGEPALDLTNKRLYTENASGTVIEVGTNPTSVTTGDVVATSLDISGNIDVDGTTNLDVVDIDGAVDMASTLAVGGVVTANAGVVVDNITIDGQEIDVSSGNLTLDVAGETVIDSGSSGILRLKVSGTDYGMFFHDNTHMYVQSNISDGDMVFRGKDGGSTITALTLDMSAAGAATFNSSVTSTGLTVNASGGRQYINSGHLRLSDGYNIEWGGGTNFLRGNNSTGAMSLTATGDLTLDASGDIILDADGADIIFADGGTQFGFIGNSSSNLVMKSQVQDKDIVFKGNDGGSTITALTLDMSDGGEAYFAKNIHATSAFLTTANNDPQLTLISTDADASSGPVIKMYRNSGSPADSDQVGRINFTGRNDNSQDVDYARIITQIKDASDGTEDGRLAINTIVAGEVYSRINIIETETVFNDESLDLDFRVESNGNTHMLFVDGGNNRVGIGTSSPSRKVHITEPSSGTDGQLRLAYDATNYADYSYYSIDVAASNPFLIKTGGSERFRIASDGSLSTPTAGTSNVRFGVNAGNSIASGGNYNVVVGDEAGTAITTGDENTFIGYTSGDAVTTATGNTAVGFSTLTTNVLGSRSVAVGRAALQVQNPASATNMYNTAVGFAAGEAVTTGVQNTLIGGLAGDGLTSSSDNTAVGYQALGSATTGNENTAVGHSALFTNILSDRNVALGLDALRNHNQASSIDSYNTAVGYNTGAAVTTGTENTLIGGLAGDALTDSDRNVAVGFAALGAEIVGQYSTAIGWNSLGSQSNSSAANALNTAVGYNSGAAVTTGVQNTLIGGLAGDALTDADYNTALGYNALTSDTLGSYSTAIGRNALYSQNFTSATASHNTAIGYAAGEAITTGVQNTFIGSGAGDAAQTVSFSSLFGQGIACGDTSSNECNGFGYAITAASGYTTIGVGTHDIRAAHGNVTWATVSDERYKKDIVDSEAGLSFINALQPRTFKYKTLGELPETFSAYEADSTEVFKNSNTNHGFIAQEVKAAIDADSSIKDGFRLWDDRDDGSQEVAEAALIPVLTKAIQELSAQVEALTARIETLEG